MVLTKLNLSEKEWSIIDAIADTFIPPIDPDDIKNYISPTVNVDVEKFATLTPSKIPKFRGLVDETISNSTVESIERFSTAMKILSRRATSLLLTRSTKLISEMTLTEREQMLLRWYYGRLDTPRILFRALYDVCFQAYVRTNPMFYISVGHPEYEKNLFDETRYTAKKLEKLCLLDLGSFLEHKSINLSFDVIIVGSGASAGVVALHLGRLGYSVLVIEKGKYYHESELMFNDDSGARNLFENSGSLLTRCGSMIVSAGATLGGGTTINWSASLRTPQDVCQQFSAQGAPLFSTDEYQKAMDYVWSAMGCHHNEIDHSFTNRMLLNGAAKLKYAASEVDQNTGGEIHNCGFCTYGCRFAEKQGTVAYWLKEAQKYRVKILDQTQVIRIIHSNNIATGVEAISLAFNTPIKISGKQIVVSCGSLQTPGLLKRSKFKNRHIGKNLKLHPSVVVLGDFPNETLNPFDKPIMTTVVSEFSNLDGKGYGTRLEAVFHQPIFENHFIPWRGGKAFRKDLLCFNHLAAILVLTRDKTNGIISYDKAKPQVPIIDYSVNKFDCNSLKFGAIKAANICYIEGASRIIIPDGRVPVFETSKPKQERQINDKDFQQWVLLVKKIQFEPTKTSFGSAHQMGTCRMNDRGPKYGAVDGKGRLYECSNVFIPDTSIFPEATGVNPMITCMATAEVIARKIADELSTATSVRHCGNRL